MEERGGQENQKIYRSLHVPNSHVILGEIIIGQRKDLDQLTNKIYYKQVRI